MKIQKVQSIMDLQLYYKDLDKGDIEKLDI